MTETERFLVLVLNWLTSAVAVFLSAYILPGVSLDGFTTALVLAVVLAAINIVLRPIIIILTLPLTVLTLGLFALVINALLIMLASFIVPGFVVSGFWWALAFSLILSVVNTVFYRMSYHGG